MKTIGLVGGLSWASTLVYYKILNEEVTKRLGKHHSAKIALQSVDFQTIEDCQMEGGWSRAAEILGEAALKTQGAGADFILVCSNTMHKVADKIASTLNVPLLHIADTVANELKRQNLQKALLLGTRFTMEHPFYRQHLEKQGFEIVIPAAPERELIQKAIYEEMVVGNFTQKAKEDFVNIIERYAKEGVQGAILGCTEIPVLLENVKTSIPHIDTLRVHALHAVELALANHA